MLCVLLKKKKRNLASLGAIKWHLMVTSFYKSLITSRDRPNTVGIFGLCKIVIHNLCPNSCLVEPFLCHSEGHSIFVWVYSICFLFVTFFFTPSFFFLIGHFSFLGQTYWSLQKTFFFFTFFTLFAFLE